MKKTKMNLLIGLGIVGGIILLLVLWYVGIFNSLIRLNEEVNNKWAQVETQYQRRVDLIPNLVNTVKGAANFEQTTFEEITKARSQWQTASGTEAKVKAANNVESALGRLLVVVENYPQLKATQNYLALQDELANTENKIAVERGRFNDAVRNFNAKIKTFPSNIVAGKLGYVDRTYFNAKPEAENAPTVNFS
ncbi:LemA family protein [Candidatus Woesearchaeota archaeon]|nr:LemA family protein [Candidatus Woesearchaeota archaeon]